MEKERGKRKIESLFGPGAIPKENVQRISTYKPNLDQFDLSLIFFTDTAHAHATLFTSHPLRPLPCSHPLLLVTLGRTTTPHASRTAHSPPRFARYFVLYKTSCPVELFESRVFA